MKIAVIQFPGSNCERETVLAIQRARMEPVDFLWNEPVEKLSDMDGFVIVGGFSYEDRSRAGIIAAQDPVIQAIKKETEKGKPLIGICNGAQILVESGLVPGIKGYKPAMALAENKRVVNDKVLGTGFYNAWVQLTTSETTMSMAFTNAFKSGETMNIPSAHAEGRFLMSDELYQELKDKGCISYVYCDNEGNINKHYPTNPNGSLANIAAVSNLSGNVMAIMPHPERTPNGDAIFNSMREYIESEEVFKPQHLDYLPKMPHIKTFHKSNNNYESIVELSITDNHAVSVQNALQQMGMDIHVKRLQHWEISANNPKPIHQLKQSGVLFNDRKECERQPHEIYPSANSVAFLVRENDNMKGLEKLQMIKDHYHIEGIESIKHGVIWVFSTETGDINQYLDNILNSNIISNPYAYECFEYRS